MQGPTGKAGIATWGKVIWEASSCLTGQGALSERGISLFNRPTHHLEGKGESVVPRAVVRKEFIFGVYLSIPLIVILPLVFKSVFIKLHPLH